MLQILVTDSVSFWTDFILKIVLSQQFLKPTHVCFNIRIDFLQSIPTGVKFAEEAYNNMHN